MSWRGCFEGVGKRAGRGAAGRATSATSWRRDDHLRITFARDRALIEQNCHHTADRAAGGNGAEPGRKLVRKGHSTVERLWSACGAGERGYGPKARVRA